MKSFDRAKSEAERWAELIAECKAKPLAPWQKIHSTVLKLNSISGETGCTFFLSHVKEGATGPTVVPQEIPVEGGEFGVVAQVDSVGSVISEVLTQLPASVRTGTDSQYQVWQVRLDEEGFIENEVGTTTLLMVLLKVIQTDECYYLPVHENSEENWKELTEMYAENFPTLSNSTTPE